MMFREPRDKLCTLTAVCLVTQSCLTLCNPMDCSPPGSSVRGDSPEKNTGVPCPPPVYLPNPGTERRSPTLQADSLPSELWGKPFIREKYNFRRVGVNAEGWKILTEDYGRKGRGLEDLDEAKRSWEVVGFHRGPIFFNYVVIVW